MGRSYAARPYLGNHLSERGSPRIRLRDACSPASLASLGCCPRLDCHIIPQRYSSPLQCLVLARSQLRSLRRNRQRQFLRRSANRSDRPIPCWTTSPTRYRCAFAIRRRGTRRANRRPPHNDPRPASKRAPSSHPTFRALEVTADDGPILASLRLIGEPDTRIATQCEGRPSGCRTGRRRPAPSRTLRLPVVCQGRAGKRHCGNAHPGGYRQLPAATMLPAIRHRQSSDISKLKRTALTAS
jgi:hypothetical protein